MNGPPIMFIRLISNLPLTGSALITISRLENICKSSVSISQQYTLRLLISRHNVAMLEPYL